MSPPATQRFDTIDLLRGLSILAVVLLHTYLRLWLAGYPLRQRVPKMLAHLIFFNGGKGVTIFFAISGFLITLTSLRRFGSLGSLRPQTFYRIRFARIAPLLLMIVAILSVLALLQVDGFEFSSRMAPLWRAILAALTFHLNWLEARHGFLPAGWDVLWSLSIEEMFYLFFPLVCLLCFRLRRGMTLFTVILIAFVIMGPFAKTVWTSNEIWQEKSYLGGMDGIALGCLTALLTHKLALRQNGSSSRYNQRLLVLLKLFGGVIISLTALGPGWYWKLFPFKIEIYDSLLALATCAVMMGSVLRQPFTWSPTFKRLTAPLCWYGRHSYELYLTHEFIVVWAVTCFLRWHPNATPDKTAPIQPTLPEMICWFGAVIFLTAPLAWMVARFFSDPMNQLLRGAKPPQSLPNN